MRLLENYQWRNKVTPTLLKIYDQAMARRDRLAQNVILEYSGNFRNLSLDIEVLSALDQQLQVSIPLVELPVLASLNKIRAIKLPDYVSTN
jgi:hypothetical protein